jgi:ferrous iron transport protein B
MDLPGTYSLDAKTPDEAITRDVLLGRVSGERRPRLLVAVADATNLERNLGLVLELRRLGTPVVLALNMMDLARSRGLELDLEILSRELGVKVVPTVAVRGEGLNELLSEVERLLGVDPGLADEIGDWGLEGTKSRAVGEVRERFAEVDRILSAATRKQISPTIWTDRIDRVVLHPFWGIGVLVFVLGVMFQAIFDWASIPADWIESAVGSAGGWLGAQIPEGPIQSLVVDGVFAGVGSVLVFLPQILLLFSFILVLEDSGYMARAAFLMDRVMGRVGLHGRAFIPLLSGYACAIPAVMATRTIDRPRDRLTTILIAPLMTCSARLPVYTLLISAFIPRQKIFGGWIGLQGTVNRDRPPGRLGFEQNRFSWGQVPAAVGHADLQVAEPQEYCHRTVGSLQGFRSARRYSDPVAVCSSLVPFQLPQSAHRCAGARDSLLLCGQSGTRDRTRS